MQETDPIVPSSKSTLVDDIAAVRMNDYPNAGQLEKTESPSVCGLLVTMKEQTLKIRYPNICVQKDVDETQPVDVIRRHSRAESTSE